MQAMHLPVSMNDHLRTNYMVSKVGSILGTNVYCCCRAGQTACRSMLRHTGNVCFPMDPLYVTAMKNWEMSTDIHQTDRALMLSWAGEVSLLARYLIYLTLPFDGTVRYGN